MKGLVIDSSIVLKWYLKDEDGSEKALALLDDFIHGKLDLFAPDLLYYELLNALIIAQRRGRIVLQEIENAIEGFVELDISLFNTRALYKRILYFAETYRRSAYDAAYLSLSEDKRVSYLTADLKLYNAVKDKIKWVSLIDHYKKSANNLYSSRHVR